MTVHVPVALARGQVAFGAGEAVYDVPCDACGQDTVAALAVIVVDRVSGDIVDVRVPQACVSCQAACHGDGT